MPNESGYHFVNVLNGEHDAQITQGIHRSSSVIRYSRRGEKSRKLKPAVAIRGNHHSNLYTL
ncbi:MAG: hypothetical protein K0R57_4681 [Paenibacillaceae bacterium]|nr:hypothetical protein [Paenibacillaceae bacterium]